MLQITVNDDKTFSVTQSGDGLYIDEAKADWDARWQPNGLISVLYNNKSFIAVVEKTDLKKKVITLTINGEPFKINIKEPIDQLLNSMGLGMKASTRLEPVKAPMPGMVLKILVTAGQQVNKGDGLIILEAMKMENVLKASAPAKIKTIKAIEKTAVEKGAVLIELE